jgi:hypothetical protein
MNKKSFSRIKNDRNEYLLNKRNHNNVNRKVKSEYNI